jgi:GcrA cell cycle regulator
MGKTTWTQDQIETMMKGVEDGLTSREIGDKIGKTRDAVLGKVHRMGFGFKHSVAKIKEKPTELKHEKKVIYPVGQIPLHAMEANQCRYMGGGYDDFLCCGKEIYKKSFCQEHYDLCFIPPKSKKETDKKLDEHREKTQDWENTLAL